MFCIQLSSNISILCFDSFVENLTFIKDRIKYRQLHMLRVKIPQFFHCFFNIHIVRHVCSHSRAKCFHFPQTTFLNLARSVAMFDHHHFPLDHHWHKPVFPIFCGYVKIIFIWSDFINKGLWTRIYEYVPRPPIIDLSKQLWFGNMHTWLALSRRSDFYLTVKHFIDNHSVTRHSLIINMIS